MHQDATENRSIDTASSSDRRCYGTCAQEDRLEMQRRVMAQAERLVEMQRRNLALEEQLLEWQKKSIEQDERILEMQKRTASLEGRRSDVATMEKAEMKLKDADATIKELEAIMKDLQANQRSSNMPPSNIQSTTTTPMDSKAAKPAPPQYTQICEKKEELLKACNHMQNFETTARNKLTKLTIDIRQTPDHNKYLEHQRVVHELRELLGMYQCFEMRIQSLCSQHGGRLGGETDEAFQNLRKRNDEGRKIIEDIIEEARKLVGPPDIAALARQSPRAAMILALDCSH
ncbi:hypothetical protein BGZ93_003293 [Podila epicladia]|nr:hypothetical protein BGZ92_010854 [Podila epicladia]KAG0097170.1 hypothetical protein BGZ93_003293 [Podila epicladia]